MTAESAAREQFLRTLALWTLVFWVAVYALLTARSLLARPDLPILSLAGLRAAMVPVGLLICGALFVVLDRISRLEGLRRAAALAVTLAVATVLYFSINFYVFHLLPSPALPQPAAVVKILSYLVEFFWLFPAWALLYLFLRWRLRPTASAGEGDGPEGIWVKDRGQRILVRADAIRWIEAERDYARIHTGQRSYLVRSTMAALERELSPLRFVRIHRRVIAPAQSIQALTRSRRGRVTVNLDDGTQLPAGRTYLHKLKQALDSRSQERP